MATAPAPATPAASTKVERTMVKMEDGREVGFTTKQRLAKDSTIHEDGSITGIFDFRNGKTVKFTVPPVLVARFAAHGMEQKIGDSIAGEKDLDDAFEAMSDLAKRLTAGDWTAPRQAGSFSGTSILIRAVFELKNAQTDEDKQKIKDWLDTKSQAEKLALRKSPQLAPIVERLEAEKATKSPAKNAVDTASLLGELDGEPAGDVVAPPGETGGEAPAEKPAKAAKSK